MKRKSQAVSYKLPKLSKAAEEHLDSHKRHLEYKLHDAFRNFYETLLQKHGECQCDKRGMYQPPFSTLPQAIRHLKHHDISADLLESAMLTCLKDFLSAGVIVPRTLLSEPPRITVTKENMVLISTTIEMMVFHHISEIPLGSRIRLLPPYDIHVQNCHGTEVQHVEPLKEVDE